MMQTSIHVIANAAVKDKTKRFRSLYNLFNRIVFKEAYEKLNKDAATGIDQVTWKEYGENLEQNLIELEERMKQKRYWPQFVKRVMIPKPNGKMRPIGISVLEDKIVQQVAADILMALYEPKFLPCSYSYRPKLSAKQAVIDLQNEIRKKYAWVVEADIKGFFDNLNHGWILKFLETRVDDRAFLNLINRFLKAGVLTQQKTVEYPDKGSPQGGIVSPVLANIYLHYVLDLWFQQKVKPNCRGEAVIVRYADDFVAAFRYHTEAKEFYTMLIERLKEFSLDISEEKTRIMRFNRFKKEESESFVFLGYEFRWILTRRGFDTVSTKMSRKKLSKIINEFSIWCKDNRNKRITNIMGIVKSKLRGIRNYFSIPGNSTRIHELELLMQRTLYRHLNRRSERKSYNWNTFTYMWNYFFGRSREQLANTGIQLSFINELV